MKLLQSKLAITATAALIAIGIGLLVGGEVDAKSIQPSDIGTQSYVIGEHLFTRESNPDSGYEGYINTRMIMLAAKTISGNTIDDMDIYYKKTDGTWVDGLTNEAVDSMPANFNIRFKNLSYYLATPTLTATAVGPSIWYNGYEEDAKNNYIGTASYTLEASNHDDYDDIINGVPTITIDKVEFFVRKADLEQNTTYISSCEIPVNINSITYCQVEDGTLKLGNIYSTTTPITEFGKTYRFISRIRYAYKGTATYSQYSNEVSVTAPSYHQAEIALFPGEGVNKDLVANGEAISIGVSSRYGYIFNGWYIARECTAEEKASYGMQHDEYALCPTDTPYNIESPVTADIKVAAKWTAKVYSIEIMPTDAVGAIMGTAKVYADGTQMGDRYTVYTIEDDIPLFDSQNPSIALSELNSITNLKLVITYNSNEGGENVENTFTTTAAITVIPYSN